MTKVMQQSGNNGDFGTLGVEPLGANFAFDDIAQLPRDMEYADAVCKARMGRAWKYKLRHSQLFDSSKALKFRRVDQMPRQLVELFPFSENN